MTYLDNKLKQIQGEPVNEVWPLIVGGLAIWGLIVWAAIREVEKAPKHPKWRKIWDDSERMHELCAKQFPDNYTKVKAGVGGQEASAGLDYESYKANPDRVKCQMTARIKTLKKFIEWVSKVKAEEICKYNKEKYKPDCMQIVEKVKQTSIRELRDLTRVLANSSAQKPLSKMQFNKLNKVLGMKKGK